MLLWPLAHCRYRKRGVNDAGRVANEVEIEQVVDAGFDWRTGFPLLASLVQVLSSSPPSEHFSLGLC